MPMAGRLSGVPSDHRHCYLQATVFLANQGTASVGQVASKLGIGRPAACLLIDSLVQRGLASRCDDPADWRRVVVRLSAKGSG